MRRIHIIALSFIVPGSICVQSGIAKSMPLVPDTTELTKAIPLTVNRLRNAVESPSDYKLIKVELMWDKGKYLWAATYKLIRLLPIDPSEGEVGKGGEVFLSVDLKTGHVAFSGLPAKLGRLKSIPSFPETTELTKAITLTVDSLCNAIKSPPDYKLIKVELTWDNGKYLWTATYKPIGLLPVDLSQGKVGKGGEVFLSVDLKSGQTEVWFGETSPLLPSSRKFPLKTGQFEKYNIKSTLDTARKLQGLGKEKAIARLTLCAKANPDDLRTIVMCRMLFKGKKEPLRRPLLGGAVFYGGTTYDDWPLEPITIFEGIPILITQGYVLAGKAESAGAYLSYCIREGLWVSDLYEEKTAEQIKNSVNRFMKNTKWKEPLSECEKQAFLKQSVEGN